MTMQNTLKTNAKHMPFIQVKVDEKLKKAIKAKAKIYGVTASSLIKIVLTKSFLQDQLKEGNVFNAKRDNKGKGLKIDDLIDTL